MKELHKIEGYAFRARTSYKLLLNGIPGYCWFLMLPVTPTFPDPSRFPLGSSSFQAWLWGVLLTVYPLMWEEKHDPGGTEELAPGRQAKLRTG